MSLDGAFWRGRRVLVTGHTGFKGAWLALLLERLGAEVTGYALAPPTEPSLFVAAEVARGIAHEEGDIRDAARLSAVVATAQPEIVFHLAAQSLVRRARAEPVETFSTNVVGTVQVLEAIRACPAVRAAVVVTSDKVYDNPEWGWPFREIDRLGGREPYGASKAAAEIAVEAWRHAYFSGGAHGVALGSARAGNVIGGGDWAEDRLVPDAMRAFVAGRPLVVRAPGSVRPWQHVLEPVLGYCLMAEALAAGRAVPPALNFGPAAADAWPVAALADRLADLWGGTARWERDAQAQPYEARLLEVDASLARAELGWRPRWDLARGLEATVAWYRGVAAGADMRALTLAQIDGFLHG